MNSQCPLYLSRRVAFSARWNCGPSAVPELTASADIKLNGRHLLRTRLEIRYRSEGRTSSPKSGPTPEMSSRDRLAALSEPRLSVMVTVENGIGRSKTELGGASKSLEEVVRETGRSPESIKKAAMRLGVSFKPQANIRRSNYAR